MNLLFAFLSFLGVLLTIDALRPRPPRVRLTKPESGPLLNRLLDAFFAPAAMRVASIGRGDIAKMKEDLEIKLRRAGYPPPFTKPEDVFAHKLFTAGLLAVMGFFFFALLGLGSGSLAFSLILALIGWKMPDNALRTAEQRRREALIMDAASVLDRLAIHVAAGNPLPTAVRNLAESPGQGPWLEEMRKIGANYAVTGDFAAALDDAVERNGGLPEIARVCERLKAAYEMGGGKTSQSLRQMAQEARTTMKLLIAERGYRNAVLMVIPALFALIAISMILLGPGAVRMFAAFGG
jgi:pilus assembly protein TadC